MASLGCRIASCSEDTTIRLWPMPDLSKPPLHTLPREELIAKLKPAYLTRFCREVGEVPRAVVFSTRGARSRTRKYVEHPEVRKRRWGQCIAGRSRKLVR